MKIFFQWLWLALVIFTGLGYAFNLGFFHKIYQYDISHLTLVIYLIFLCVTLKIGWFSWNIGRSKNIKRDTEDFSEMASTWATRTQYVGILGSVWGMGIAFSNIEQTDILAKVGTCVFCILISMGAFLLLDIQNRHVVISIKKEYLDEKD